MPETISIKHGKIVGVRTSIYTIFNAAKYDAEAIPTAWKKFFSMATGTELGGLDTFYGASIPSMDMDAPMDYFAGALVAESAAVPDGFESVEIPEGNYLKVIHTGPITNLAASYQRAYMQELGTSGKEMRPAPHLEIYNPKLDPMATNYEMVIAVPVK
jgi:predicted transcriptional regulator YdeE